MTMAILWVARDLGSGIEPFEFGRRSSKEAQERVTVNPAQSREQQLRNFKLQGVGFAGKSLQQPDGVAAVGGQ